MGVQGELIQHVPQNGVDGTRGVLTIGGVDQVANSNKGDGNP